MATMNMEVVATFLDNISGPARAAAEALEQIRSNAERLTSLGSRMTESLTGFRSIGSDMTSAARGAESLVSGLREIETINITRLEGVAGAIERIRLAVGGENRLGSGMSGLADGADRAAGAFERMVGALGNIEGRLGALNTSALDRLGSAADRAGSGAGGSSGGGSGGSGRPSAGSGQSGGGEGLGSYLGGALAWLAIPKAIGIGGSVLDAGGDVDAVSRNARMNGLSDDLVASIRQRAEQVAQSVPQTTIAANMRGIMDGRLAFGGNLELASSFYEKTAKAGEVISSTMHDKSKGEGFSNEVYDLMRSGELANYVRDPKMLGDFLEGAQRTAVYSQGRISPKDYASTATYLRGSLMGLEPNFFTNQLPFLMQELQSRGTTAGQAGSAINQMAGVLSRATVASKDTDRWVKDGLADPDKVQHTRFGNRLGTDSIYGADIAQRNPFDYAGGFLEKLETAGFKTREDQMMEIRRLSGNQRFVQAMDVMTMQRERMKAFEEHQKLVGGIDQNYAMYGQGYEGSKAAMSGAWGNLSQTVGNWLTPIATAAMQASTSLAQKINRDAGGGGDGQGSAFRTGEDISVLGRLGIAGAAHLPFAGAVARSLPWLARAGGMAIPGLNFVAGASLAGDAAESAGLLNGPAYIGRGQLGLDPYQHAVSSATAAKADRRDYANASDLAPLSRPGAGPIPVTIVAGPGTPGAGITAPATMKAPDAVKLPDATSAGSQAGSQVAAGVISAQAQVAAAAQTLMAAIRAALGGGVDVPVRLQGWAAPAGSAVPAGSGGLSGGARRNAMLTPAVRASVQTASAGGGNTVNDNRRTNVAVTVQGAKASPSEIAAAVHEKFKTASRAQLSDGLYS